MLRRLKIEQALATAGVLECEVCGFNFEHNYGTIGHGFIGCHHMTPPVEADERETGLDELALVRANCHRMLHRAGPLLTIQQPSALVQK